MRSVSSRALDVGRLIRSKAHRPPRLEIMSGDYLLTVVLRDLRKP